MSGVFSLAVQNFIEAVDAILVEDSYQLPSPVDSNCLTAAKVLNIWMKKPENNSELDYLVNIFIQIFLKLQDCMCTAN